MGKNMQNLKFSKTHEWIEVDGDYALIGISDYAQHHLGEVVFVDLPNIGDVFQKDEEFGAVESVKAASDLMLPVAGEIIEINEKLNDEPNLLNSNCYDNYIVKIKIIDINEIKDLMNDGEYEQYCKKEK